MKRSLMALSFALLLAVGAPLTAFAGPSPPDSDADSDGIGDGFDNCLNSSNADQADADHDGCGDVCDADITCDASGDTIVGVPDFNIFLAENGNDCNSSPSLSCTFDCTGDGIVGVPDFNIFLLENGNATGPTGLTNPSVDPTQCGS